jgi:2-aminoadipate transaminase
MADSFLPPGTEPGKITYKQLSEHIKSMVLNGVLTPGTRLPAVRKLSTRLEISNLTVHRAYAELARSGFTSAATSRGTQIAERHTRRNSQQIIANLPEVGPFNTFEHVSEVAGLRSFATALPDPALVDSGEVLAEIGDLRSATKWMWGYAPTAGHPDLIAQIGKLLASQGIRASGDEIIVTLGETHAISLLAEVLCGAGGRMLLQDPFSLLLRDVLINQHVEPVPFYVGSKGVDFDTIEREAKEGDIGALLITPAFSNVTGLSISAKDREKLLGLAVKYDFQIIELGSYRLLAYDDPAPEAMAATGNEKVVFVDSFSYTLAPGLRLGYIRCSGQLRKELSRSIQVTMLCPPPILQLGLANYIAAGRFKRHLTRVLPKYKARRDALVSAMATYLPKLPMTYPAGGFASWVTLPPGTDSEALVQVGVAKGIAFTPGTLLSMMPDAKSHIRLSYALLTPEAIHEGIKILSQIIATPRK